jgi:hypothetical protein
MATLRDFYAGTEGKHPEGSGKVWIKEESVEAL